MEKHRKLLRHSAALTNHTRYCCVRAIIVRRVHALRCVFVCESVQNAKVLLSS